MRLKILQRRRQTPRSLQQPWTSSVQRKRRSALLQTDTGSAMGYGFHHHKNMFTGEMVFLQTRAKPAAALQKVQAMLAASSHNNARIGLLMFTLKSKLRLAQKTTQKG